MSIRLRSISERFDQSGSRIVGLIVRILGQNCGYTAGQLDLVVPFSQFVLDSLQPFYRGLGTRKFDEPRHRLNHIAKRFCLNPNIMISGSIFAELGQIDSGEPSLFCLPDSAIQDFKRRSLETSAAESLIESSV